MSRINSIYKFDNKTKYLKFIDERNKNFYKLCNGKTYKIIENDTFVEKKFELNRCEKVVALIKCILCFPILIGTVMLKLVNSENKQAAAKVKQIQFAVSTSSSSQESEKPASHLTESGLVHTKQAKKKTPLIDITVNHKDSVQSQIETYSVSTLTEDSTENSEDFKTAEVGSISGHKATSSKKNPIAFAAKKILPIAIHGTNYAIKWSISFAVKEGLTLLTSSLTGIPPGDLKYGLQAQSAYDKFNQMF